MLHPLVSEALPEREHRRLHDEVNEVPSSVPASRLTAPANDVGALL